ncbi:hypothetical protein ELH65_00830 [Rhizobium ruizarguesonis]|nr:hypothetical protein ELH65_00830 [Rhizobium ruizarguesonis]
MDAGMDMDFPVGKANWRCETARCHLPVASMTICSAERGIWSSASSSRLRRRRPAVSLVTRKLRPRGCR